MVSRFVILPSHCLVNSLVPGRSSCNFKNTIFNLVLFIAFFRFYDDAIRWMLWYLIDVMSTLVQVVVWCRQASSHYLSQCWPRSMSTYGVTRLQWMNSLRHSDAYMRLWAWPSLVQMACRWLGDKLLSEPMLHYCQLDPWEQISENAFENVGHFVSMG